MKFFTHIMALLLLTLSLMPCGDTSCSQVEYEKHFSCETTRDATSNDHQNSHHNDHCSPLCFCGCCNTNLIADFEFDFLPSITWFDFDGFEKVEYKLPIIAPIYYSIWEPPQLLS